MNSYCSASSFWAGASWAKAVGLAALGLATGLVGCSRPPEHSGVPAMSAVAIAPAGAEVAAGAKDREAEVTVSAKVPAGRPVVAAPRPVLEAAAAPVASPLPAAARPERDRVATRIQAGRVLDESGQPLVGATIILRGTSRGTSTDATGGYMLEVPRGENTFVVGYAGYESETASSHDGQPLTVTLVPTPAASPAPPARSPRGRR